MGMNIASIKKKSNDIDLKKETTNNFKIRSVNNKLNLAKQIDISANKI